MTGFAVPPQEPPHGPTYDLDERIIRTIDSISQSLSVEDRTLFADYLKQFPPDEQLAALDALVSLTWRQTPVGVRQFIQGEQYLNLGNQIFPRLLDDLEELFSGPYTEAICTGGIGWGKSTFAELVEAIQLYQLGCLVNPPRAYGLREGSSIAVINVAINKTNASQVVFGRVTRMIDNSPWFQKYMPRRREKLDHMEFENSVWLAPLAAFDKALVGFDTIGGVIDEVNEMAYGFESTRKYRGEMVYDQAQSLRDALIRRMTTRFHKVGAKLPGILAQIGASRYPGEYTERRIAEAKDDPTIFCRQYSAWDTNREKYSPTTITVALGSLAAAPRICKTAEEKAQALDRRQELVEVPDDLTTSFEKDIYGAIRDYIGRSTAAITPFIPRIEKVFEACQRGTQTGLVHPFGGETTTLRDGSFTWATLQKRLDLTKRYFFHGDLAKNKMGTGDRAGLALGHIAGMKVVIRTNQQGEQIKFLVPHYVIDFMVRLVAPPDDEIKISAVKGFLFELQSYGVMFASITFDQWQSLSLIQDVQERMPGTVVGELSVDKTDAPYNELKDAFNEDRIDMYEYAVVQGELVALERNNKTGKVDHPPGGSKDVADALAAISFQMSQVKPAERAIMSKGRGRSGGEGDPMLDLIQRVRDEKAARLNREPEATPLTPDDILFADADDDMGG